MKSFKGWRTLTVNILSVAISVAEIQEWTDIIAPEHQAYFSLGLAVANIALRYITTTPVGRA